MSAFFSKRKVFIWVLLCILAFTCSYSAIPVVLAKTTESILSKKNTNSVETIEVPQVGADAVSSTIIRFHGVVKSIRRGVIVLDTSSNTELAPEFMLASSTTVYLATSTGPINSFPHSMLARQGTTTPIHQRFSIPERRQMGFGGMTRIPFKVGDAVSMTGRLTYDSTVVDGVVFKNNSKHGLSKAH